MFLLYQNVPVLEIRRNRSLFWCHENLRECILFLLSSFRECILNGSLKHYFIPGFNLLSVKLTPVACGEIVQTLDIVLQSDISMMKECKTLKPVWDQFVNTDSGIGDCVLRRNGNMGKMYACLMHFIMLLHSWTSEIHQWDLMSIIYHIVFNSFQNIRTTSFISFVLRIIVFQLSKSVFCQYRTNPGNRTFYRPCRYLHLNLCGFDISTCRLWFAMIMTMRCDSSLSLRVLNCVLFSIPPYALLYSSGNLCHVSDEAKHGHVDIFSSSDNPVTERARKDWMFDLIIMPSDIEMVPAAIQIELTHCDKEYGVRVSPFVCAYYLMFLNYHVLHQFENRDRALRQLVDTVSNQEQCGSLRWFSYNIAGHCLLHVGLYERARDMFIRSYHSTYNSPHHRFNSARLYLQSLPL